ncbi:unnamed protein product [Owenia fusiformis]|uniref:Uncharacterized protein n=1 Tax=Owenia fusiformis TaxID=6347 RepID=A0A8J1YA50_OWEFU|nr:unnamed protein product [Owenia fusiformis]
MRIDMARKCMNQNIAKIIVLVVAMTIIVLQMKSKAVLQVHQSEKLDEDILKYRTNPNCTLLGCDAIQQKIQAVTWKNLDEHIQILWEQQLCHKRIKHPGDLIGQRSHAFDGHSKSPTNHISTINLVKFISKGYPLAITKYGIDLGASGESDVTELLQAGWKGFKTDGRLKKTNSSEWLNETTDIVTPKNVQRICETYGIPKNVGVLKIDIDSYDWDVVKAFLEAGVSADIYSMEYNPVFPPGVHYHTNYTADFKWTLLSSRPKENQILYGASLRAWYDLLTPNGYTLIDADWYNTLFVKDQYVDVFGPIPTDVATVWQNGWFERPGRHTQKDLVSKYWLNYPRQEVWATMETTQVMKELQKLINK